MQDGNDITVSVTPHDTDQRTNKYAEVNQVLVSVDHHSNRKAIVASVYPAESKGGIRSIMVTNGKYLTLAPAARLSRKQVAIWTETARNHVALRQGVIWDLVLSICKEANLTPTETAVPQGWAEIEA